MFIQNVSLADIKQAWHYDPGENSLLISIVDTDMDNPVAKYPFKNQLNFKFLDIEEESPVAISKQQANDIAQALIQARANKMNVIVHCVAGICRSGAVTECGIILGFDDTETYRQPNLRVKSLVLNALITLGEL